MADDGRSRCAVLLVGFMGSGKSTVGRALAVRLGWRLVDVDRRVEERAGSTVEEIFRDRGEEAFRRLEAEETRRALEGGGRVVATGGGWAAREGRLAEVPDDVLTVWLRVGVETALDRARRDPTVRPLLRGEDAAERARALLERRRPFYRRAELHLDTEGREPEEIAGEIVGYLRSEAGRDGVGAERR